MKKIMLILFDFINLEEVIQHTFNLLESNDKLYVIAIREEDIPSTLFNVISNVGFLGKKVTSDLESAIAEDNEQRVSKNLDEIITKGKADDKRFKIEKISKKALTNLKDKIENKRIDYLIINYSRKEFVEDDLSKVIDGIIQDFNLNYEIYQNGQLEKKKIN